MTTKTIRGRRSAALTTEAGGWLALRRPAKRNTDPPKLLTASQEPQLGNLRYAIDGNSVFQIAELRDPSGVLWFSGDNDGNLKSFFESTPTTCEPADSEVAEILSELPGEWAQPEGQADRWQAVVNTVHGERCELTALVVSGGVEVTAQLANWEGELSDVSRAAVAQLLVVAHGRIRIVRFQLQAEQVNAVSFAAAERLDIDLPESVAVVVTAVGRLGKSVRALLQRSVAEAYVEIACGRK